MNQNKRFILLLRFIILIPINTIFGITLDEIALKYGTDKGSGYRKPDGTPGHKYTINYEKHLEPLRNTAITLLEIGFWHGDSAQMWEEYFPNATLHFIDIDPRSFEHYGKKLGNRCHFYIADQSNAQLLDQVIKKIGKNLDIIIDDGSHLYQHQISSFKTLFPHLKSNGMYIIEDMHAEYWGSNNFSAMKFLYSLVDDMNFVAYKTWCADYDKCPEKLKQSLTYYQHTIKEIHFYSSLCIIVKR